jgi:hypothetical protein
MIVTETILYVHLRLKWIAPDIVAILPAFQEVNPGTFLQHHSTISPELHFICYI